MTRIEMEDRVKWLENRIFLINMIDHWTYEDKELYREFNRELEELKENLNRG